MNSPLSPLCPTPSQVQPYLLGAHPSSPPGFLGLQSPNGFPGFRTHNRSASHSWYEQIFSAHLLQIPPTHPCRYPCPVPSVSSSSFQSHLFIMFNSFDINVYHFHNFKIDGLFVIVPTIGDLSFPS